MSAAVVNEAFTPPQGSEGLPGPVQITETDREWLANLGCQWPEAEAEGEWLDGVNHLVEVGSRHLGPATPAEVQDEVVAARYQFVGALSKFHPESGLRERLFPPDRFIRTQRLFTDYGISAAKVIESRPDICNSRSEAIAAKLEYLSEAGLDVATLVEKFPAVLSYGDLEGRFAAMRALGLDIHRVVAAQPSAIGLSEELIAEKLTTLQNALGGFEAGIGLEDVAHLVNVFPRILGYSSATVKDKIGFLAAQGLDHRAIVQSYPAVLSYSPESMIKKLRMVRAIGRMWGLERDDVAHVVNHVPSLFGVKPAKLRTLAKIANLSFDEQLPKDEILIPDIRNAIIGNIEATLVGYLEKPYEIEKPRDIKRLNHNVATRKLGKEALKKLIYAHPNDPAVKEYLKGYPKKTEVSDDNLTGAQRSTKG